MSILHLSKNVRFYPDKVEEVVLHEYKDDEEKSIMVCFTSGRSSIYNSTNEPKEFRTLAKYYGFKVVGVTELPPDIHALVDHYYEDRKGHGATVTEVNEFTVSFEEDGAGEDTVFTHEEFKEFYPHWIGHKNSLEE